MKNLRIIAMLVALLLVTACLYACGETGTTPPADATDAPGAATDAPGDAATEAPAAETEAPAPAGVDLTPITSGTFGKVMETGAILLTFTDDGANGTFTVIENGVTTITEGAVSGTDADLTIGDKTFAYKVVGTFLTLTEGETKYSLTKATDETLPLFTGAVAMLTNKWTGDGAELSFDGANATVKLDALAINYVGPFTMTNTSIAISDASQGDPTNFALDCAVTASGMETADYPPELAVDGDYTTRFASAVEDPSWIAIDLGAKKTIGAAKLFWEAANSKVFDIEVSDDGENWTSVYHTDDHSTYGTAEAPVGDEITFTPVETQFVRIYGTERNLTYGHSLFEVELYESIPGTLNATYAVNGDTLTLTVDGTEYTLTK